MERYEVVYKLDSDSGFSGTVEVYELANTISAFAKTVEAALDEYPENGNLRVEVKPFKQGSFITEFILTYSPSAINIFSSNEANALSNILGFLGFAFGGAVTLPKIIKKTKGKINKFRKSDKGTYIYGADQDSFEVSENEHKVIQSSRVAKAYKEAVTGPIFNIDNSIVVMIQEKSDFETGKTNTAQFFTSDDLSDLEVYEYVAKEGVPEDSEEIVSTIENAIVNPVLGSYLGAESGYAFKCGKETFRGVQILDTEFRMKLESGEIRLMGNDVLIVDIEDRQSLTKSGKVSHHRSITKVKKYQKYETYHQEAIEIDK